MNNTKDEKIRLEIYTNEDKSFEDIANEILKDNDKKAIINILSNNFDLEDELLEKEHEMKIKESYFHNMCAAYEADIKGLKKLINIYKKSGNNYYLIDKDDFNEFDDFYSVLSYIDFMELKDYKLIKGVIIDERIL